MKTLKDIRDMVIDYSYESHICNTYGHLYCDTCPHNFTWCFIDSCNLALDYLERGEYYG